MPHLQSYEPSNAKAQNLLREIRDRDASQHEVVGTELPWALVKPPADMLPGLILARRLAHQSATTKKGSRPSKYRRARKRSPQKQLSAQQVLDVRTQAASGEDLDVIADKYSKNTTLRNLHDFVLAEGQNWKRFPSVADIEESISDGTWEREYEWWSKWLEAGMVFRDEEKQANINKAKRYAKQGRGESKVSQKTEARQGSKSPNTHRYKPKLKDSDVRDMRKWYTEGTGSVPELAEMFNRNHSTIYRILRGETYRHVD